MDLLCSYYTKAGKTLESSPERIIKKAHNLLKAKTGFTFEALGELEYYLFSGLDSIYPIIEQKGYHESHPFSKWGSIRAKQCRLSAVWGARSNTAMPKWAISSTKTAKWSSTGVNSYQSRLNAADQLVLAKWAMREVAYKYNLELSFAPKIIVGHAGVGCMTARLVKDSENMMINETGLAGILAKKMVPAT
ncbi:MAG: hypothetical protein MZV70_42055 [Desulfobacterales bacterium]|nr:hypothetical protein [Desulfobacterales bacterium]